MRSPLISDGRGATSWRATGVLPLLFSIDPVLFFFRFSLFCLQVRPPKHARDGLVDVCFWVAVDSYWKCSVGRFRSIDGILIVYGVSALRRARWRSHRDRDSEISKEGRNID